MKRIFIALLALSFSFSANAATLTADSGWSEFSFANVGNAWSDSFTFTITQSSKLTVTDGWQSGDVFEVFSNGTSLGQTSAAPTNKFPIITDYDVAALSPDFSTRIWTFLAGTYEISGIAVASPWWTEEFGAGLAALRLDTMSPVPAPAALWLLTPPTLFLLGIRRRVKNSIES